MSKRELVQPEFNDYPLDTVGGKVRILNAWTFYKWDEHYWFAILVVESKFGEESKPKVSVRGYRWKWKSPYSPRGEDPKPKRWMRECHLIFNKKSQWDEFKVKADEFVKELGW